MSAQGVHAGTAASRAYVLKSFGSRPSARWTPSPISATASRNAEQPRADRSVRRAGRHGGHRSGRPPRRRRCRRRPRMAPGGRRPANATVPGEHLIQPGAFVEVLREKGAPHDRPVQSGRLDDVLGRHGLAFVAAGEQHEPADAGLVGAHVCGSSQSKGVSAVREPCRTGIPTRSSWPVTRFPALPVVPMTRMVLLVWFESQPEIGTIHDSNARKHVRSSEGRCRV